MRRPLSIGTRWAILYTTVTLVVLSVPIGFIYINVKRQTTRDAALLLESYLAEVRSELEAHPEQPGVAVGSFTARLRRITPILDYGAALIPAGDQHGFAVGSLEDPPRAAAGSAYVTVSVPFRGGTLEVAISKKSFSRRVERILSLVLIAAPLALGLSALCGAWLARRSLQPIAEITRSAQRIGGENLSERIPVRGTGDELDRLAETLNGMFDRIARAMERLHGFSVDAAHQLKSPVASLRNQIEVRLGDARLDDSTRQLLEGMLTQVSELGTSVSAVLRLARSESGLSEGQAVPVDLSALLEDVASLFHPIAEERGIALVLELEKAVEIMGDVSWLRELFANLVDNAIVHTPEGGRVGIDLTAAGGQVEVRVSDTGEGIAESEQQRIFDRFYRISPARGVPGSGLGLALAQQIAIAHGGTIEVESAPGAGSTFSVRLPRRESSRRSATRRQEPERRRRRPSFRGDAPSLALD